MRTSLLLVYALACILVSGRGEHVTRPQEFQHYESPRVVTSPGYPRPYRGLSNATWVWEARRGFWGVVFLEYHVTTGRCRDYVFINDSQRSMIYCSDVNPSPFYSTTSKIRIQFVTGENPQPGNFKLSILYGKDIDELRKEIYYNTYGKKDKEDEGSLPNRLLIPILVVLGIIACISCALAVVVCLVYRKRCMERRRDEMTSLGIRRGSGVRYARKSSSNSDTPHPSGHAPSSLATPTEPSCTIDLGDAARPWTVRAVMTNLTIQSGCVGPSTVPKHIQQATSHAHGHAQEAGHAHRAERTPAGPAGLGQAAEKGGSRDYTPLPTGDSRMSGAWPDESQPMLED